MLPDFLRGTCEAMGDTVAHLFPRIEDHPARRAFIPDSLGGYCPRCGVSAGRGAATDKGCADCLHQRLPWHTVIRLGAYYDPLRQWILHMKFHGQWHAANWLGKHLASAIQSSPIESPALIVPVPMHWTRRCQRGYNPPALIASAIASQQGQKVAPALRRIRRTRPQTKVAHSARARNVRNAFAIRPRAKGKISGRTILLVDDIKTTGATAAACARILNAAGAKQVHLAVAAVADPPNWPTAHPTAHPTSATQSRP